MCKAGCPAAPRTRWFLLPFCWLPYTVSGKEKSKREDICASWASVLGDVCHFVCDVGLSCRPKAWESGALAPRGAGSVCLLLESEKTLGFFSPLEQI